MRRDAVTTTPIIPAAPISTAITKKFRWPKVLRKIVPLTVIEQTHVGRHIKVSKLEESYKNVDLSPT